MGEYNHIVLRVNKPETVAGEGDQIRLDIMTTAKKQLSAIGIGIPRLFEGVNFTIEPFVLDARGTGQKEKIRSAFWHDFLGGLFSCGLARPHNNVEKYARLLAKIHSVAPDWYDPFRERYIKLHPELDLASVSHGHPIWWNIGHQDMVTKYAKLLPEYLTKVLEPKMDIAKRIVTVHGDYHWENVIIDSRDGKYWAIDLENTHAGWACFDIAYSFQLGMFDSGKFSNRRLFVHEYLKACGLKNDDATVDEFLWECCKATMFCWWPSTLNWELENGLKYENYHFQVLDVALECIEAAEKDPKWKKALIEAGGNNQNPNWAWGSPELAKKLADTFGSLFSMKVVEGYKEPIAPWDKEGLKRRAEEEKREEQAKAAKKEGAQADKKAKQEAKKEAKETHEKAKKDAKEEYKKTLTQIEEGKAEAK